MTPPFDRVVVDEEVRALGFSRAFLARLPRTMPVEYRPPSDPAPSGRRTVHLTREPGAFLKPCPCSPGVVGCGYRVLSPVVQCPFSCSYCFLRFYSPDVPLTLYANLEDAARQLMEEAREWTRPVRLGTGEFADSLALDPWTDHARWLADLVEPLPGVTLELKTKSDRVDALVALGGRPNVVVAWSVNPPGWVEGLEGGTAALAARLAAARRVVEAGYRVAFHFDPIVLEPGWEPAYRGVVDRLAEAVPPDRVAWVSLGTLRFPARFLDRWGPALRGKAAFFDEFVPCEDGKLRYFWPRRRAAYRAVADALGRWGLAPERVYLCMEGQAMWQAALGRRPGEGEVEGWLTGCRSARAPGPLRPAVPPG